MDNRVLFIVDFNTFLLLSFSLATRSVDAISQQWNGAFSFKLNKRHTLPPSLCHLDYLSFEDTMARRTYKQHVVEMGPDYEWNCCLVCHPHQHPRICAAISNIRAVRSLNTRNILSTYRDDTYSCPVWPAWQSIYRADIRRTGPGDSRELWTFADWSFSTSRKALPTVCTFQVRSLWK